MMGMPRLTRLELGISLNNMSLEFLTKLTQLTSLSLNMEEDSDMVVYSEREEEWADCIDPSALCPLSALRQLRELRLVHSSVPQLPPGILNFKHLLYLEFHNDWSPGSAVMPSLTQLAQLQAVVLRGMHTRAWMRTLSHDPSLTCLVNLRVLMVDSKSAEPWFGPDQAFTNSFAAFHMSCLQVLDISMSGSCQLPTHWLASMHQLQVLAVCSNALVGALPAHTMPLLKILIISVDWEDDVPCTQPVLHVDTPPSVIDRMQSPKPLSVVCQESLLNGMMPAAQVRTLASTGNFLVICKRMPVRRIHQLVLHMLGPGLKQLCNQLPYLTIPGVLDLEFY